MVKRVERGEPLSTNALFELAWPMIEAMRREKAELLEADRLKYEAELAEWKRRQEKRQEKFFTFQDSIAQIHRFIGVKGEFNLETKRLWYIIVKTQGERMFIKVSPTSIERIRGAKEENYELHISHISPARIDAIRELRLPDNRQELFDTSPITLHSLSIDTFDEAIIDTLQPTLDLLVANIREIQETKIEVEMLRAEIAELWEQLRPDGWETLTVSRDNQLLVLERENHYTFKLEQRTVITEKDENTTDTETKTWHVNTWIEGRAATISEHKPILIKYHGVARAYDATSLKSRRELIKELNIIKDLLQQFE